MKKQNKIFPPRIFDFFKHKNVLTLYRKRHFSNFFSSFYALKQSNFFFHDLINFLKILSIFWNILLFINFFRIWIALMIKQKIRMSLKISDIRIEKFRRQFNIQKFRKFGKKKEKFIQEVYQNNKNLKTLKNSEN